jgi:hypothetical protein
MRPAPIALFAYKRPAHLQRTVATLRANAESAASVLTVFCDGPKSKDDMPAVGEVRRVARAITGFARIELVEREHNAGLARSIIEGVSAQCDEHGHVIVIEDDLLVSPNFLGYMNAALRRYADEPRVMQVAGYMFPAAVHVADDALFLPVTSSWGWGTWSRAWALLDQHLGTWAGIQSDERQRRAFDLDGAYDYSGMVAAQQRGDVDSWAIRWYVSVFARQGLVLFPRRTLVENMGFDASGTHGPAPGKLGGARIDPLFRVRALPENIEVSPAFGQIKRGMAAPSRLRRWWNGIAARASG